MQSSSWIALLRVIPAQQFDNLALTTSGGVEINLQTLIRTEEEYVILRGRLSGSTDTGRIFFVPYDQINFIHFIKPVKEAEVNSFYGKAPQAAAAPPDGSVDEAGEPAAVAEETPQPAAPAAAAPAPPPSPLRAPLGGRSAILDRLRRRVAPKPSDK